MRRSSGGGYTSESCAYTATSGAFKATGSDPLLRLAPATPENAKDERALLDSLFRVSLLSCSGSKNATKHEDRSPEVYPVAYVARTFAACPALIGYTCYYAPVPPNEPQPASADGGAKEHGNRD